jgi:hypothetical protein
MPSVQTLSGSDRRRAGVALLGLIAANLVLVALSACGGGSSKASSVGGITAAVPAFGCSSTLYLVADKQLYSLNLVDGTRAAIGAAYPNDYNAMGYNVADNFIYAIDKRTDHLLRVDSHGSVDDLGLPSGLPAGNYYIGDMAGTRLDVINAFSPRVLYSIDVSTGAATAHTLTGVALKPPPGDVADVVNIDGTLYGANGNTIYAINLSTYSVSKTKVAGLRASSYDGSAWTDSSGDLILFDNRTGHVDLVTGPATASPSARVIATLPASNDDDGASCGTAPSPSLPTPTATGDSVPPT